jgi:hypothetical protein
VAAAGLGRTDGAALTGPQVAQALGSTAINGIARRLGLSGGGGATAIGDLAPHLLGQLTPGGVIGLGGLSLCWSLLSGTTLAPVVTAPAPATSEQLGDDPAAPR